MNATKTIELIEFSVRQALNDGEDPEYRHMLATLREILTLIKEERADAQGGEPSTPLLEACKAALPCLSAHEQTGCDCPDSLAARSIRAAIADVQGGAA